MAHDGSDGSNMEDWIVQEIQAEVVSQSMTSTVDVRVFAGAENHIANQQVEEVLRMAGKPCTIQVYCSAETNSQIGGADYVRDMRFTVIIAVQNEGNLGERARRGEGTDFASGDRPGTNKLRDVVFAALNDKLPPGDSPLDADNFEAAKVGFANIGWLEQGLSVVVGDVFCRRAPAPA